jgi:hypothetical protein
MEEQGLSKQASGFGLALATASIANALLVTAKEKSPKVLAFMKGLTGNHWITHCAAIILLFLILGWVFSRMNGGDGLRLMARSVMTIVVGGVVLGALIIVGFYLIEG